MKTRREFVGHGLIGGAVLATTGSHMLKAATGDLAAGFSGQLLLPGDRGYESARQVVFKNPRTDRHPAVVARCKDTADVTRCLQFAQREGLIVAPRSGGHSMVGWGTCDSGIVIDTSPLRSMTIDPVKRTATIGAGVLSAELAAMTASHNLAGVVAQCPTVAISGLMLGGGLGYLSGLHGATCDTLLSAELVMASGEVVSCSANENADLFWAIRGGGGNFGIVTSMTFELFPVSEVVTGTLSYDFKDARKVLNFFSELMSEAPDALQGWAAITQALGEQYLAVGLCWAGDPAEGERLLKLFHQLSKPLQDTLHRGPYTDTFSIYPAQASSPQYGGMSGCYVRELSDPVFEVAIEQILSAEGAFTSNIGFDHYMHGQVCRVDPQATAFDLRMPGASHAWIPADWSDPAAAPAAQAWMDETWKALNAYSTGRMYTNYPAFEDTAANGVGYQQNLKRLTALKHRYDPDNVFTQNYNLA